MKKALLAAIVLISFSLANAQHVLTLTQLGKLTDANGFAFEQLGTNAAISIDTAVMTGYGSQTLVNVYVKGAAGWNNMTQAAQLAGSDGQVTFSNVAISGNTVAAAGYDSSTAKAGIYIFVKPSGGWTGTVTETAILATTGFVAISGSTIVVGAEALYDVFVKPSGGWKSTSQPNATLAVPLTAGSISTSMAIAGNTVVIGAPENFGAEGTVYVYSKPSAGWSGTLNPTATLIASNGKIGDGLGWSVAVNGSTIAAGATAVNQVAGAAYLYVAPASGWTNATETAELSAANTLDLGWFVGVSGNAVVVSAPFTTVGFNQFQGEVAVYLKPTGGWKTTSTPNTTLTSSDGAANDLFGLRSCISGGTILATSPQATVGSNQFEGAAYVFGK